MRRWMASLLGALLVIGAGACTSAVPASNAPERSSDAATLASVFEGLGSGPYSTGGSLTPDGVRVSDVLALQGALVRFRLERGRFPGSLDDLGPEFAPAGGMPRDPETGQPYSYDPVDGGTDYRIATVLSNGRSFLGLAHVLPEAGR